MIITKESKRIIIEFDKEDNQDFKGIVNCEIDKLIHLGRLYGNQDVPSTQSESKDTNSELKEVMQKDYDLKSKGSEPQ